MAGAKARQRGPGATSAGTIEQQLGHDPSSGSLNEPDYRQDEARRPAAQAGLSLAAPSSSHEESASAFECASTQHCTTRRRSDLP
jgi:hypothetical protein